MARKLADAGIQVTAISDSAVFAMMARANKVCALCTMQLCTKHHQLYSVQD